MAEPFLGEIRSFSFAYAPRGWAFCDGHLMLINQNQALFALLGTTYGGDGRVNFALPDLRGRVPLHFGTGIVQGQAAGEEAHTLTIGELPQHTHVPQADANDATAGTPVSGVWAANAASPYSGAVNAPMSPTACGPAGGSQPHPNRSPFLTLNFCMALQGIFPSRD